jgi:NADH-quinone oxidoreductase subunit N
VQGELKRLLAYSSIAHAGTLLLLVAAGMRAEGGADALAGVSAALYYLAGYLFTAMGAFGLVALLESEGRSTRLEDLSGLWRERPLVAGLLALFLLSLGGIPATAGFLGKWFVFAVLVREGLWSWVVPAALLSVVALAYYLRVIVALFMQEPRPEPQPACRAAQGPAGLATGLCAAFVLALGVFPRLFLDLLAP